MRDLSKFKERFTRDSATVRMGNLASNLQRLSTWVQMGRPEEAVIDLMKEIAWSILTLRARQMFQRILQLSGLLNHGGQGMGS